ncbi:MAG: xanthine dehydrogenase family protein molybdopterin-binding subunit [Synergistaceae bacterium]|nr:xanthine dehydrogenase family protein molybdopterin-binding subunit [Synergistaceae bacterium]
MKEISRPVIKEDHSSKFDGSAVYVGDWPTDGMLFGYFVRSTRAHARIRSISAPNLREGYFTVDHRDVPGQNCVHIILDDMPVFAGDTVEYIGEPILMVVGPDECVVRRIAASEIAVEYDDLPAVLNINDSVEELCAYRFDKGDADSAFKHADMVFEERFETGPQEQAYLETQGIIAEFRDGRVTLHGSMQCPYYVHEAVARALNFEPERVRVVQDVTGGGFGGKEDYPSILACQVSVAAIKAGGKPVRVILSRREDMSVTTKRHPSISRYRVSVKDGRVTGMDIDVVFDGGAYTTLSPAVLQRGLIAASAVYDIPNLKVRGRVVRTNTPPNGAFRGFGAPQTIFAAEMIMSHIARSLWEEPTAFKLRHAVSQGDKTSTGGRFHFPVPISEMMRDVSVMSQYHKKRDLYENGCGRFRRGIGMSMWLHGVGFTGSGERDIIKARVCLHKYPDGRVEVLASNTDIGQGVKTAFRKIAANELLLPQDMIIIQAPDTDRVPDSGPTVASRSVAIVGELIRSASRRLREDWRDGADQVVEEQYAEPDFIIPFSLDKFSGDAYPAYSWGVCAVELQVDSLTGVSEVVGVWASFDVGTPIDINIVMGQMEGGILQGLGYAFMERIPPDGHGRILNDNFADYAIPTASDVPNIQVKIHEMESSVGPYGAKGAGELPLVGVPAAYIEAMEHALGGRRINHIPFGASDVLDALSKAPQMEVM